MWICDANPSRHPHLVVANSVSLAAIFFLSCYENRRCAHAAAPPLRKRSRAARLFACKRALDAALSLPTFCGYSVPRANPLFYQRRELNPKRDSFRLSICYKTTGNGLRRSRLPLVCHGRLFCKRFAAVAAIESEFRGYAVGARLCQCQRKDIRVYPGS